MAIRSFSAPNARETQMNISAHGVKRRSKRVRLALRYAVRFAALGCVAAIVSSSGGCMIGTNAGKAMLRHDKLDEWMVDYRNQAMAAKAWHCRKEKFCNRRHLDEFQAGFYAGYENIACGGTGCTPAIVPKEYWGWKHQSADGQAGVNSWFEGYPMGVQAAEMDGIGHWSQIRPMGLSGPQPGSATGMRTYMDGGVPVEGMMHDMPPMDGAIQGPIIYENTPNGMSGSGVMLESGPQVLMNNSTSSHRKAAGSTAPFGTDGKVAPVGVTSEQVDLTQSLKAVFGTDLAPSGEVHSGESASAGSSTAGSSTGASASIDDTSSEIPFSFK